jgi:hypothetical protein
MDDANLSKLSVKSFPIDPPFEKTTTEYSLTVPSKIGTIEIEATTSDSSASFLIKFKEKDGNKCSINEGLNKITIEVSSEDGTTKLYNLNCHRLSASDASLSSLAVSNLVIQPAFNKDIFDYFTVLPYNQQTAVVDAQVNDPNCEIKLIYNGKELLKSNTESMAVDFNYGMTFFEIHVKSPDGTKTKVGVRFFHFKKIYICRHCIRNDQFKGN